MICMFSTKSIKGVYMASRKFKEMSAEKFKTRMDKFIEENDVYEFHEIFGKDLKVQFDFENYEMQEESHRQAINELLGYKTLSNGLNILGITAGGDWEFPVYFLLYISEKDKIRAYIPRMGNTYNRKTMEAHGNGEDDDDEPQFDRESIKQDILKRFEKV